MKDPYVFDFIPFREDMLERDIEQALVRDVTKLLLELETGFAFLGNQYHLNVGGDDFYIDLLFYNLNLRCYVVIELKTGDFKPEYVGQLNFYLSAVDGILKKEQDNPSIGLLLCKSKNNVVAEYSLKDISKPIGVSEYKITSSLPDDLEKQLPSVEDIQKRIKDVVYIYQNQIDDRGESKKSENEVFNACQEAIDEIQKLIRKLTGYVSATRFLITADHGFIYKRDKLKEYDKISMDKAHISLVNKRYLLSLEPVKNEALVSRTMTYLGKLNQFYVTTPMGVDIIKAPGGGQNYVHGGSSLQEMIVPVVKVITYKGKQDTSAVNVELSYSSNRITDIMVFLDFMQMEAVTDTMKPRKLIAFFVDENGTRISYDVPIIADSTETDPRKRMMREKFILKSGNYSRGKNYYLVLTDMENEEKEHQRYRFEIDIAGIL